MEYSCQVGPGDLCVLEGESAGEELIQAIYEQVLRAGGHPIVLMTPERAQSAFFALAGDEQLDHVSPIARLVADEADVRIRVIAPENPRELSDVEPALQVRRQRATGELMERVTERTAAGNLRWAVCQFPTAGQAADAEMSAEAYEDFLYRACLCHVEDPVAAWEAQAERIARLVEWAQGREQVQLTGPGTDLRVSVAGRRFLPADGRRNMPDGELFTGPVEDSAEGDVTFHLPAIFNGREVSGVRLRFRGGEVVDASAETGEPLLLEMLDTDPGARRLGELGIGTNYDIQRGTRSILFDEKIGGTVHLALGRSYPETGGVNESALHWDLICDLRRGGAITIDAEDLQRDGQFVV